MESKIELKCNDITFCCKGFVEEVDDKYYNMLIAKANGKEFINFMKKCGGGSTADSIIFPKDVWVKIDSGNKQVIYPHSGIYECDINDVEYNSEESRYSIRVTMFYGMVN